MASQSTALPSPKQATAERRSSLFPYYAGYSASFVTAAIDRAGLTSSDTILDPWNGAGTTTAVAAHLGLSATGIDLNPALHLVASARLATKADAARAQLLLPRRASQLSTKLLRALCENSDNSLAQSLIVLACFRLVRRALTKQDLRASNPTWWLHDAFHVADILAKTSTKDIGDELGHVAAGLFSPNKATWQQPTLFNANMLEFNLPPAHFDLVVSSPPYLTRIDYVKATLPELYVLSHLGDLDLPTLRRQMIGSPVIGSGPTEMPLLGEYSRYVLTSIATHHSKASRTYYLNFFSTYISKMYSALQIIARTCKPNSQLILVVQGSHYKELFIDLGDIIIEAAASFGFILLDRVVFPYRNGFAQLNPRAAGPDPRRATESAIFLRRTEKKT